MSNKSRKVRISAGYKMLELAARVRCSPLMLSAIELYDDCRRKQQGQRIAEAFGRDVTVIWPSPPFTTGPG